MAAKDFSSALKTGFKIGDKAIKDGAAIAMTKIGNRTLEHFIDPATSVQSGSGVGNAVDGIGVSKTFPDANIGNMYTSLNLPVEWLTTSSIAVRIFWKTTAVSGNVKFSVLMGSKAVGEVPATDDTQIVTSEVHPTASKINISEVTFANTLFAVGDTLGINLKRDPADAADTASADILVLGISIRFIGQG